MTYILDTLNTLKENPEITEINPTREAPYYLAENTRLLVFTCLYQNQPGWGKIFDDPRQLQEIKNISLLPDLLPDNVKMPKVLISHEDIEPTKGWYIMEKLEFTDQKLTWEEYLDLYKDYRQKQLSHNLENKIPHINKAKSTSDRITQKINKWFNLEKQYDGLPENKAQIITEQLVQIKDNFLPEILNYFKNSPLLLSHSLLHRGKIHINSDQSIYVTDYAHLAYQYEGYDLAIDIWAQEIIHNFKAQNYQKAITSTLSKIKEVQDQNIFEDKNHIVFAIMERCLGTLFADIWASDRWNTQEKLNMHNTILELLNQLKNISES